MVGLIMNLPTCIALTNCRSVELDLEGHQWSDAIYATKFRKYGFNTLATTDSEMELLSS